jgi:hypothetical protein
MEANFNPRQHEHSKNPDTAGPTAPIAHPREGALDGIIRFVIIFGYLWVVFAWPPVHKGIMLSEYHLHFLEYLFAIVNLLVFAKVLLGCKVFHLRTGVSRQVPHKSHPFRLLFEEESFAAFTRGELKEDVTTRSLSYQDENRRHHGCPHRGPV